MKPACGATRRTARAAELNAPRLCRDRGEPAFVLSEIARRSSSATIAMIPTVSRFAFGRSSGILVQRRRDRSAAVKLIEPHSIGQLVK
jgi:hypothetical protein